MQEKIKALAEKYFTELVIIRRHLHANPELSFEEFETSKYIKNILKDWKINFEENFCKTGFVAKIVGQKNKNNKK
ncbi:MAG: amidohydrolase, partial [Bacteroidota bacterium]